MKTIVSAMIILFCISCQSKDEVTDATSLKDTKWKLVGIVDETGALKILEPRGCKECYTLTFDTDSTFSTYSSNNELSGVYIVDYAKHSLQITNFGGTKAGEFGDGELYVRPFWNKTIQSFFFKNNELRLFYNDSKNYLLFKLLKP